MPLLESSQGPERPADKHPRGACYWAWFWSDEDRLGAAHFEDAVDSLSSSENAQAWLGKLNELDASADKKEAVADRLRGLLEAGL